MVTKKKNTQPPFFGSQGHRFGPLVSRPPFNTTIPHSGKNVSPGQYDDFTSCFSEKALLKKAKASPGWARALLIENQAKMPHILYKEQWQKKQLQKQNLGPCSYNIKDFIDILAEKQSSSYGVCESRSDRFKSASNNQNLPGPGTYYRSDGIGDGNKTKYGTVGIIAARVPRPIKKEFENPGPGTYDAYKNMNSMLEKTVGNRGPYDLFTGPRTLKFVSKANKYRTSPFAAQYEIKSNIDILFDESTSFRGKFAKADRWNKNNFSTRICLMNPLNPETPGPGQYHIGGEKKSRGQPAPPFASSAPRGGGFNAPTACTVSPDRYDILLWQEKQPVNGHCSVFRSKTKRPTHNQIRILNARLQNCPQPPDTHIQDNVSTSIRKALNNI